MSFLLVLEENSQLIRLSLIHMRTEIWRTKLSYIDYFLATK